MVDHSEFPWGPETVPGLLTPLGAFGWLVAAVLAVLLLVLSHRLGKDGGRSKKPSEEIRKTYKQIRAAADYAMSLDNYSVLAGAQTLRHVIKTRLGRLLGMSDEFSSHLTAIAAALDEGGGHGETPGPGHGSHGHGRAGSSSRVGAQAVAAGSAAALAAVGNNVHGPSITVNVGVAERPEAAVAIAEPAPGHDGDHHDDDHHNDDHQHHGRPLTLEERLVLVRRRVSEFQTWWRHEAARIDQMEAALKDLTQPADLDPRTAESIKPFAERTPESS